MRLQLLEHAPAKSSKRPPLLFVHGAYCAAWVWKEFFFPWYARQGYHCYAVSLRGHGGSEGRGPVNTWSLADYLADVEQTLQQIPKDPVLIGHSMGAVVVQKLLEKKDFPAAVLMAPSPPDGLIAPMMQLGMINPGMMSAVMGGLGGALPGQAAAEMLFPSQTPELKARYAKEMEGIESVRVGMDMSMGDTVRPRKDMSTPVTVVGAQNDELVPLDQLNRTAKRYGVEPLVVPDISHLMMLDGPWEQAAEAAMTGMAS